MFIAKKVARGWVGVFLGDKGKVECLPTQKYLSNCVPLEPQVDLDM